MSDVRKRVVFLFWGVAHHGCGGIIISSEYYSQRIIKGA